MRIALLQIVLGIALLLVGCVLAFVAYDAGRTGVAIAAGFGAVIGFFLLVAGDSELQAALDAQALNEFERELVD